MKLVYLFRKPLTQSLTGLLLCLCLSGSLSATTLLSMSIDEVTADAELIFEGEVLIHEVRLDANTGMIYTYVTFAVRDIIKGSYDSTELELRFNGGTVNGETVEVSGLRLPEVGEQGIYFVESISRNLLNPLLGWSQGHYLIQEQEGQRLVHTADRKPITAIQPVSDVPTSLRRARRLIEGNNDSAEGVVSAETLSDVPEESTGMSVERFKDEIRALLP